MSDYILTYSKIKFYPLNPNKNDINIEDIAHALSLIARANGHFKHFYSVAQHSINCYLEAKERGFSKRVQLGCLLHDASESYISDLTRPVKNNLSGYFDIEKELQNAIYEVFELGDLNFYEIEQINYIDDILLYHEFSELMDHQISDEVPDRLIEFDLSFKEFTHFENEFILAYKQLVGDETVRSYVGIDGCKGGWVAVYLSDFDRSEAKKFKKLEEIFETYPECDRYIIDMPIGLVGDEISDEDYNKIVTQYSIEKKNRDEIKISCNRKIKTARPDKAARTHIQNKSSVFSVPCRQATGKLKYKKEYNNTIEYEKHSEEAKKINHFFLDRNLSQASLCIIPKIREVDEFLQKNPEWKNKLLESHPEICFSKLDNNCIKQIKHSKKDKYGQDERKALLRKYCDKTDHIINNFLEERNATNTEDVVDALCLAIMAKLIDKFRLKSIVAVNVDGANSTIDATGIKMQMVYTDIPDNC